LIEHAGVTLSGPNGITGLPSQMSDEWIQYVANKLINNPLTEQLGNKINQLLQYDRSKIIKYVSAVDKSKAELNFLKLGNY
jgi:hypothetical protein